MIILPFSYAGKRGWDSAHPAFSCKEILDSDTPKVNEVGILLIQPFPVKKFWTLDTPKETGSIESTLRRVETL